MTSDRSTSDLLAAAQQLQAAWRLEEAEDLVRQALERGDEFGRASHQLSVLLAHQGFSRDAIRHAGESLLAAPWNRATWHNYLTLCKHDEELDSDAFVDLHREFGAFFSNEETVTHWSAERSLERDRRLRVAYLSPDAHLALNRFVGPILLSHDQEALEVFAYWGTEVARDRVVQQYPRVTHRFAAGRSRDDVAAQLVADRIDIAVDLAGHGAANQLPALQRRPAPIQVTWLDYLATTGVPAIDYRLSDWVADPAGNERFHTEHLIRLPRPAWCYEPWPGSSPPRAANPRHGTTLGGCVASLKLGDRTLRLWRSALEALPEARLVIVGVPGRRAEQRVLDRLGRDNGTRVEIRGRLSIAEYLGAIQEFDIALDSVPFSGATTTFDCLNAGVPVVTLAGRLPFARSAASILRGVGLPELITDSENAYVDRVVDLVRDGTAARLRTELPVRLRASGLLDQTAFARQLQNVYRTIWHRYIEVVAHPREERAACAIAPPNHLAEHTLARARQARADGNLDAARALYRAVIAQLPGVEEARREFWRLTTKRAWA